MKKVHIFDLDGTLIDSMPFFAKGVLQVLEEENVPYGDDLIDILTPLGDEKTALLYQEMGVPGTVEEIIVRMQQNQYPYYAHSIPLNPGIEGYLRRLKADGCTLCVLTASPHVLTDAALKRNGVFHLFDHVWSIDDYGLNKSQTALFDAVTERLGCEKRDIRFYDDNITAVTTAVKAGWEVWAVNDHYDDRQIAALRAAAHGYVADFTALAAPEKAWHIFDLDGTLVDSMSCFRRGILQVLDEDGIPYGPDMADILTPLGYTKSAQLYQTMGVRGTVEEIVSRIQTNLHHQYAHNIRLKSGVDAYLRKLKSEGCGLCVLTASPHLVTDVCLQHNGVYDLFDHVWSVEDYGMSKGETRIYDTVTERLGCDKADIRFYDDNLSACTTAVKAGWYTLAVNDGQNEDLTARLKAAAHGYVADFADLV